MTVPRAEAVVLAARHLNEPAPARSLVTACRTALDRSCSVGLALAVNAAQAQRVTLAAAGPLAAPGEALQLDLGEGPCIQALDQHPPPVLVADLHHTDTARRWPVYAERALACGIQAVFAFPVLHGPPGTGRAGLILTVYRNRPGPLSDAQRDTAHTHAHAADLLLLTALASAEDDTTDAWFLPSDAVIHQAIGKISYRHSVTIDQALALLRAHAHTHDISLTDLARAIVHDGLTLPDLPRPPAPGHH
ncbi:ANTAR domain-containing protein [Streptomyces sp. NPDC045369]|uniref:ANTAR domain-containing protein n=1 Tax=Streptomyces sp. NPDC045369 TaxID=3155732 RepID=UPI0033D8B5E0